MPSRRGAALRAARRPRGRSWHRDRHPEPVGDRRLDRGEHGPRSACRSGRPRRRGTRRRSNGDPTPIKGPSWRCSHRSSKARRGNCWRRSSSRVRAPARSRRSTPRRRRIPGPNGPRPSVGAAAPCSRRSSCPDPGRNPDESAADHDEVLVAALAGGGARCGRPRARRGRGGDHGRVGRRGALGSACPLGGRPER